MRSLIVLVLLAGLVTPASAVLIDTGDGSGNLEPPDWPTYFQPGFEYVGKRGSLSAVYVGNGWVLTANHVGAGDVEIDGVPFPWVPGSEVRIQNPDGSDADLLLFQIDPHPDLPKPQIAEHSPPYGSFLMVKGNGRNRGDPITWDPNGPYPPGLTDGYEWGSGRALRWGSNNVEVYPPGGEVFDTKAFGSLFDPEAPVEESQAVTGDSGGGVFVWDQEEAAFRLAGVVLAIVKYQDQPAGTTLHGQSTYYADLSYYRQDILDVVNMPEPSGGLWLGAGLLAALRRRRRRRAGVDRERGPASR